MSQLPMSPLTPDQQQRVMEQLYRFLSGQVRSWNRRQHLGDSTSVPAELARELMESLLYTMDLAGGLFARADAAQTLELGQKLLEARLRQAQEKLALVRATAPNRQTECRWEALACLDRYLQGYDHLHLAHLGPDELYYPILIAPPEGIRGVDACLFWLDILWVENQIFAGFPEKALEEFWHRLPEGTQNPCEQLLLNGIAKVLLHGDLTSLLLSPREQLCLTIGLPRTSIDSLNAAAEELCARLDLRDEQAVRYVRAIAGPIAFHIRNRQLPENLFL